LLVKGIVPKPVRVEFQNPHEIIDVDPVRFIDNPRLDQLILRLQHRIQSLQQIQPLVAASAGCRGSGRLLNGNV
jgi:hypothetical protein